MIEINETIRRAPVESIYRHVVCDTVTYATGKDSLSYQLVYCSHCMLHKPVNEFVLEEEQCCVLECDQPQAPLDTYCTRHAVIANQMEQLYRGALKAGFFNKETM